MKTGIVGLGAYLPERVMENAEWSQYVETTDEWIRTRTGIERRRVCAEDEATLDIALAAARVALADAGLEAGAVDEIVVASDTPELYVPDTAALVQHELGAREVPAYDLAGSGCAGFLLGLDIARSRAVGGRKVLVIGAEALTKLMDWTDRNTCVLFGDAAAAAVVGDLSEARCKLPAEILGVVTGTDGSKAGILGRVEGGTREPFSLEMALSGRHRRFVMEGREVFKEAVRRMSEASRQVLANCGVALEEIALFVPHQANLRIIESVGKALGMPEEKVFVNVQNYGNTGAASAPLALWEARAAGRVRPGDKVLATAFGAGFHWAAVLLQF